MNMTEREYTLQFSNQLAVVSDLGASLRSYEVDGRSVAWGYSGAANKKGGQGDVLIPFPSRITSGRFRFSGREYELECNDKEGNAAIHGFLRTQTWKAEPRGESEIRFSAQLNTGSGARPKGYPWALEATISYRLTEGGLECEFQV